MLKIKDVNNFEDYTVDTEGRVYSKRKQRYLKQSINKFGYCKVTLQKDKYKKIYSVHRLVAEAFIDNPQKLPQVNHIDGNKQNNNVSNLEWSSAKHNMNEAVRIGLFDNCKKVQRENAIKNNLNKYHVLANEVTKKRIAQYDKQNNFINEYESISEASRQTGITIASISYSATGKRKTGGGYIWHFV